MTRPAVIVDCETTSLVPDYATGYGVIWELAVIERTTGTARVWRMELPDATRAIADLGPVAGALAVGRFHERTEGMRDATRDEILARYGGTRPMPGDITDVWDLTCAQNGPFWSDPADLAGVVAGLLRDVTLIAAVPSFDAGFLSAFLAHYGQPARPWHYRLRDIGSMAAGYLAGNYDPYRVNRGLAPQIPALDASTDEYAVALGLDPDQFERHTALGDCRLVEAMLGVMGGGYL